MNRILRKDPIVEARCDFQFDAPDWDWTVPGLLWGQIRDEFPLKQQFELLPSNASEDNNEVLGVSQLNFWREDKSALVRIEPNELSIVQRAPYTGWPQFRTIIERVLNAYREVAPSGPLDDIALHYFNRFPLPSEKFDFEDYLNIGPSTPNIEFSTVGHWRQQVELIKLEEKVSLVLQTGFLSREKVETVEDVVMMLNITANDLTESNLEGIEMQRLDVAHAQIEELFFACFTPKYLELFAPEEMENEN